MQHKELSMAELDRAFRGEPERYKVEFLTQWKLDIPASKKAGKRIEHALPYIIKFYPDVKDRHAVPATQADIQKHAAEFSAYERRIDDGQEEPYEGRAGEGGREHDTQSHCAVPFPEVKTG